MISSRKESNVKKAVEQLKSEGLNVCGTVCHVGKSEDRKNLFKNVNLLFSLVCKYENLKVYTKVQFINNILD